MVTDLKNTALDYAMNRGWAVFPVHGINEAGACTCGADCASPGKHPATGNGLKSATVDPRGIALMFRPGHNIAIATGEPSGMWALDIDGQAGEVTLSGLEAEHGPLPATLTHFTGNGRHLLFRWPGFAVKTQSKQLGPGLDVRGDGGYIVAAPSRHVSGVEYRFANIDAPIAEAPAWLLDRVKKDAPAPWPGLSYPVPDPYRDRVLTADQVREMLSYIVADCSYDDWLQIGMGLHAGGYALELWDSWSREGAKYQAGDCYKRWKGFKPGAVTFGTVWHFAEQAGWSPEFLVDDKPAGIHPAAGFLAKVRAKPAAIEAAVVAPPKPGTLPFDPLALTGPIGDTVRWIVGSSIRPQPELALLNVLAAMGAVFGRRYATEWDTRSNIYVVGLADTGGGKEMSRKQIKNLFMAAGLQDYLAGDDIKSGAGIVSGLQQHPAQILHIDEFGMTMRAITDERAPQYMQAAAKVLTAMFSASGSVYHGGFYAGTVAKPVVIDHPHLCIYGCATLSTYREALSRSAIASGELNRFLVLPAVDDLPTLSRRIVNVAPDDRLVATWAAFAAPLAAGQGNLQGLAGPSVAPPKAIVVRWEGVLARVYDIGDRADDDVRAHKAAGMAGVWTRYREQVIKVAMIAAIARNPVVPVMEDGDLDLAEAIVGASCAYVCDLARNHIADSKAEREVNDVLEFLRRAPDDGWVSKSVLGRAFRGIPAKQRQALMDDLVNVQEAVEMKCDKSTTRPVVLYRSV